MPITHVTSVTGNSAGTYPAGIAKDDVIVHSCIGTAAVPTGFTRVAVDSSSISRHAMTYRLATGGESGTSFDGAGSWALVVYRGCDPLSPIQANQGDHGEISVSNNTTHSSASLAATADGVYVWHFDWFQGSTGSASLPASMAQRAAGGAASSRIYVWDAAIGAGASFSSSATVATNDSNFYDGWHTAIILRSADSASYVPAVML